MSDLASSAHVVIYVADYIAIGQLGKATIVGAGITIVNCDPNTGRTAPLAVLATVSFDPKYLGGAPIVELSLETLDGDVFTARPEGKDPVPVRATAEPVPLMPTEVQGVKIPHVRPRIQMNLYFPNGLPLQVGEQYVWRVRVDGETQDDWTEPLYVFDVAEQP
jgi:hypothetical protein